MSLAPADDAEWLRRAASGDEGAFASFVAAHRDGVLQRARRLTHNDADAEDLVQDTFLAAWRGAGDYRGGSARGWLLTIATNAWRRIGARRSREATTGDADTLESLALRAGWGTIPPDDHDAVAWVDAAYRRLAPDDQQVLMLRDIEGLPGEEVAQALGLTVPGMKSRLHRARLRLAATYEEVRRGST